MKPLRVVLDTNVLVSALIFSRGRMSWLRFAWYEGRIVPVICKATAAELIRVLAYPKFKLDKAERQDLLADILPYAETFVLPDDVPGLVRCRDPDDQIFLSLAYAADVDYLVSGDPDIIALQTVFEPPILTPAQLQMLLAPD